MRRLFRFLVTVLPPLGALGFYPFFVYCYLLREDRLAAVTVFPFWAWCLAGAATAGLAWLCARRPLSAGVAGLWLVTMLLFSDESRFLLRSRANEPSRDRPSIASTEGKLRVINFNCRAGVFNPKAVEEVLPWNPDIVLLQECVRPAVLQDLARRLYGGDPRTHTAGGYECGIVTRGRILSSRTMTSPYSVMVRIQMPGGEVVEAVSVHLRSAETDVRLYKKSAFSRHADNRRKRRAELGKLLAARGPLPPGGALVIGGDFNAPAGDAVFRLLEDEHLSNAMDAAGSGWPDTFPNSAPMLRIDHQWVNAALTPAGGRVVESTHSDHRMMVCEYTFTE